MAQLLLLNLDELLHLEVGDLQLLLALRAVRGTQEVAASELLRFLRGLGVKAAFFEAVGLALQQEALFGVVAFLNSLQLEGMGAKIVSIAVVALEIVGLL